MCESSMINMYSFLFPDALTNIQNGHASEKEKNCKTHTTKTYEISEFLKEVCIENVFYEDTVLTSKKCMFIPIKLGEYNKDCSKENRTIDYDDYIYQCVQGYWNYNIEKAKEADYVIALQNTIVRGIYPVAKWMKATELRSSEEAPIYPLECRKIDATNSDSKFLKKIGFVKINESDLTDVQRTELESIKSQVLNKLIIEKKTDSDKKDWFKEQNSVYNFDLKGNTVNIRKNLRRQ